MLKTKYMSRWPKTSNEYLVPRINLATTVLQNILFLGVLMETFQTVFIMRIYSKYPAKEKMGKEKKKKRGEEERKQNMKVEKTDSNSAHTRTSQAVRT